MTKEELEKEAEEWVISNTEIYDDKFGIECENAPQAKEAYLASAEPREKRIEELKTTNKRISDECHKLVDTLEKKQKEVVDLEKENEELKAFKEKCKFNVSDICKEIETENNLIKAKDLLLRFIELKNKPCAVGHSVNMLLYENISADAKQFLEENK